MAGWEEEGGISPCHYGTNECMLLHERNLFCFEVSGRTNDMEELTSDVYCHANVCIFSFKLKVISVFCHFQGGIFLPPAVHFVPNVSQVCIALHANIKPFGLSMVPAGLNSSMCDSSYRREFG